MELDILEKKLQSAHKERQKQAEFAVNLGLACNTVLAILKLASGIFGHSRALLADGINSTSDVVYFIVVKLFVKLSGKPADIEHPYGHYQYETIAALVIGAFVIATGLAIFWDSINAAFDLFAGKMEEQSVRIFTIWTAIGTIFIKIFLMIQSKKIGLTTNNLAVIALFRDHRNDVFSSLGALIGIILTLLGFVWADPIAGAVVAIVVVNTGFGIIREATDDLMDSIPSKELSNQIKKALEDIKQIKQIEEIHAHRFGPYLVANITICLDGHTSVAEADSIANATEKKLLARIGMLRKVYIHCHPDKSLY